MFQTWNKNNQNAISNFIYQIPNSQSQNDLKNGPNSIRRSFYDGLNLNFSQDQNQVDNDVFFLTNNLMENLKNEDKFKSALHSPMINRARMVKSATRRNTDDSKNIDCNLNYIQKNRNKNNSIHKPLFKSNIPLVNQCPQQNKSQHSSFMTSSVSLRKEKASRDNNKLLHNNNFISVKSKNFELDDDLDNNQSFICRQKTDKTNDISESKSAYDFRSLHNEVNCHVRQLSEKYQALPISLTTCNLASQTKPLTGKSKAEINWMTTWMKSNDMFQAHKDVEKDHLININSLNHFLKNREPINPTVNLSHDEFVSALSKEVCQGDPRKYLHEVALIGEGSTAEVILAKYKPGAIDQLNRMNKSCDDLSQDPLSLFSGHYTNQINNNNNNHPNPQQQSLSFRGGSFRLPHDGDFVAIKKMKIRKQQRRELLFNEIIIMRSYPHPNIVQMHACYLVNNELWLFMEYIEGGALTSIVTEKIMEEVQIACVIKSVLLALAFLHDHGVIHRDIKSDSILLKADGTVKLSDFGFSACITPEVPRRRSLVGTPYWMAPEVLARDSYNTAIDVWSTGVLIIEMVDGEPSFFNISPFKVMKIVKEKLIPSLKNPNKSSPLLRSMLSLMLVRNFQHRATTSQLLRHPFIATAGPQSCLVPLISTKFYKK